jgi:hypothetical protein
MRKYSCYSFNNRSPSYSVLLAMQTLLLARHGQRALRPSSLRHLTTAASAPHTVTASSSTSRDASLIPLSNVEAQWEKMSKEDQVLVHEQLEKLQEKDWKTLSIDEKKAGTFLCTFYALFAWKLSTFIMHSDGKSVLRGVWAAWPSKATSPTWKLAQDIPGNVRTVGRLWRPFRHN